MNKTKIWIQRKSKAFSCTKKAGLFFVFVLLTLLVSSLAFGLPDFTDNSVGAWVFENKTTEAEALTDLSGQGYNLNNMGATFSSNGFSFDGTNDYLSLASNIAQDLEDKDYIVCSWVKFDAISNVGNRFIQKGDSSNGGWTYGMNSNNDVDFFGGTSGQIGLRVANGNEFTDTTNFNSWCAVIDRSDTTSELYLNGVAYGSYQIDTMSATNYTSVSDLTIGLGELNYWAGDIQSAYIWKGSNIADVYNATTILYIHNQNSTWNPFNQGNFTITAIDSADSSTINTFNATINGIFYNTTNGTITTPYLSNETVNKTYAYFDANGRVSLGSSVSMIGDFFVETKVIIDSFSGTAGRFLEASGAISYFGFTANNQLTWFHDSQTDVITLDTTLDTNTEYLVRLERNGTTASVWIDGVLQSNTATVATSPITILYVGGFNRLVGSIYDINLNNQANYLGYGITNADWTDQIGSNDGTVGGTLVEVIDYNTLNITVEAENYFAYENTTYDTSNGNLQAELDPETLNNFELLTPNNSITNQTTYNITWTEAVSPTNKTVTYNGTIQYTDNFSIVDTFSTTDLFYNLDITNYLSENYTITINATEADTGASFEHDSTLVTDFPNYLYFYDEQTSNPLQNATVTVNLPNSVTDLDLTTDAEGKVQFNSYQNNILQTGNYSITFQDLSGFVTPITFDRTYNSLPINKSFNITQTNINISIFYRTNDSIFNKNTTVVIEGLTNQSTNTGNAFIQNATITQGTYRITVSSGGYFIESKEITFSAQEELSINFYLLETNNTNSGTVTIRTIDEFQRLIEDAEVNLLEYNPATLSYIEVSECYTDSNGECKFLVETNSKSYKFTATKTNGETITANTNPQVFADDYSGGSPIVFSEETITITLSSQQSYTINPIQNIIFDITESFNNVTNTSNIDVSFRSIDGTNLQVCVEYFTVAGGVETSVTGDTFCVIGSSADVTENAFFTLNRSKEYIAKVYIKTTLGNVPLESFRYQSTDSFAERLKNNATLPFVFLFVWIFLIGGGLALKNVPATGVFIIVGTWVLAFFFPSITIVSASVLQTLIGIALILNGRKKEDFQ